MLNWTNKIENELADNIEVFHFPKNINFSTMDGSITFTIVAINFILQYGNRNTEAKKYLRKIRGILSKLYTQNTKYEEGYDFEEYKIKMSNLLSLNINKDIIKESNGYLGYWETNTEKHIVVLRTKDVDVRGKERFGTPDFEKFEDYVEYELVNQLVNMRLSKETKRPLISKEGCHIEIVLAINYLVSAAEYLCRCKGSHAKQGLYFSDIIEVDGILNIVDNMLKRIKYVKY